MAKEFRGVGQCPATRRVREDNANELAAIHWLTAGPHDGDETALRRRFCFADSWTGSGTSPVSTTPRVNFWTNPGLAADRGRAAAVPSCIGGGDGLEHDG